MGAYRIDRFGSVDGIVLCSSDDPRPGLREVLMRVRASSLNYRDLMVLKSGGRGPTQLGVVPLSAGAGEVATIGEGVTRVKIGDRIAGCFHPRWFGGPIKPEYRAGGTGTRRRETASAVKYPQPHERGTVGPPRLPATVSVSWGL
jgi:NADPH:quinone reductase-like Zn-dependent oxidoreductase